MSVYLRILLLLASALTFVYIGRKLRKAQLQVMDAFFWICVSFILILLGIFPKIAFFFAGLLGVQSTVNFVFLVIIFLLLIRCFLLTIRVSLLEDKVKHLVEEIAIRENMR